MLSIRDEADLGAIADPFLRDLLVGRLADLTQGEPYDPDEHGFFVVMAPGDGVPALDAAIGTTLLTNPVSRAEYGDPRFCFIGECVVEHPRWYEIAVVAGADAGVIAFVPRCPEIDRRLLALCAEYAEPASAEV